VTARDRLREAGPEVLAGEPVLLAGPLLDREGAVQGLVVVERMPFLKFSPTNVRLFGLILDWASTALGNASLFEQALVRAVDHDLTGAYTATHTLRSLRDEFLRARRYGLPLSVVVVQVNDFAQVEPQRVPELLRTLGNVFRRCLREVDVVGHHTEPDSFVLVLPMTALDGARVIAARVGDELALAGLRPYGNERPLSVRFGVSGLLGEETGAEVYDPASRSFHGYAPGAEAGALPLVTGCWNDPRDEEATAA
jgi:GGDEF domain-containing protein